MQNISIEKLLIFPTVPSLSGGTFANPPLVPLGHQESHGQGFFDPMKAWFTPWKMNGWNLRVFTPGISEKHLNQSIMTSGSSC